MLHTGSGSMSYIRQGTMFMICWPSIDNLEKRNLIFFIIFPTLKTLSLHLLSQTNLSYTSAAREGAQGHSGQAFYRSGHTKESLGHATGV